MFVWTAVVTLMLAGAGWALEQPGATAMPAVTATADPAKAGAAAAAPATEDAWSYVQTCADRPDVATCLEESAVLALKQHLPAGGARSESEEEDDDDHGLLDLLSLGVSRLFQDGEEEAGLSKEDDEEEGSEQEESQEAGRQIDEARGKKKKKKEALMKLFMLGMLIKSKISLLMGALGTILQLKFLGLAVLNLLVGLFRLWLEWLNKKTPQKVIYYEHAQHQHHYEHEHHYDDENKGGWSGLWSRSIDGQPADAHAMAYSAHQPASGN
ncbi:uncharacterized protein LOC124722717 [Schistocerca piceifrons]|uniref:uncharacterized protein LOC124722717 n=1 Tax=Schistocerca piceifrons TaxID=274613 RepID=UPI001F5F8650|nr:uncharacterized protein LOC124722717 [Schistocerca piceifrons]